MTTQSPVPHDHPMMKAWNKYKDTPEYANTRHWALYPEHVDGSLWAAFVSGWEYALEVSMPEMLHTEAEHAVWIAQQREQQAGPSETKVADQ